MHRTVAAQTKQPESVASSFILLLSTERTEYYRHSITDFQAREGTTANNQSTFFQLRKSVTGILAF